jgi:hypothetical protein
MSRYYFNTEDGLSVPDAEGVELPGVAEAQVEAMKLVGEMLREHAREFWNTQSFTVTVKDNTGLTLFTIVTEAIRAPALGKGR